MDLEFTRGDTQIIKFQLADKEGNIIQLTSEDNLYFTVKQDKNSSKKIIQKKYPTDIQMDSDGYFYFEITSADTSDLAYGSYLYDIELKSGTYVKTLGFGTITLTEEFTHRRDE